MSARSTCLALPSPQSVHDQRLAYLYYTYCYDTPPRRCVLIVRVKARHRQCNICTCAGFRYRAVCMCILRVLDPRPPSHLHSHFLPPTSGQVRLLQYISPPRRRPSATRSPDLSSFICVLRGCSFSVSLFFLADVGVGVVGHADVTRNRNHIPPTAL